MFTGQEEVVVSMLCLYVLCDSQNDQAGALRKVYGFENIFLFILKSSVPFF